MGENSDWQKGPHFLTLPEGRWPISVDIDDKDLPERRKPDFIGVVMDKNEDSLAKRIEILRFSKLPLLIHTTARILKLYKRFKKGGIKHEVDIKPNDIQEAEIFWIKEAQMSIHKELKQNKYLKLQPRIEDGIVVVGGRTERWLEATWNRQTFILLPKEHTFS